MWSISARSRLVPRAIAQRRHLASLSQAKAAWGSRLVISEEVEHALHSARPLIALESAIITHGMPHPANHDTAASLESIIRDRTVVPATIALINGKIHVGLTEGELAELSDPTSQISQGAVKVSRRDLAAALAMRKTGGTTVAGTMYIASSLGIKVFVTGGIGGVHRGAESSMDISADLIELGRTPMAVICAGAKSILDIPRTLEVLETQGVCVATYGDKDDFPAFYHPSSGVKSPWRVPDSTVAASLIHSSLTLPTPLSTLLAVPIPTEHAEAGARVQQSVEQAVKESIEQGIDKRGKEVTPWLLKRVGELTQGKALELNIKLIENNARVGAEVATELAGLYGEEHKHASGSLYVGSGVGSASASARSSVMSDPGQAATASVPASAGSSSTPSDTTPPPSALPEPSVLVFGSAAIDLTSSSSHALEPRTTTPGTVIVTPGGVGRNIAEAAQNLLPSSAVQMISPFGSIPTSGAVSAPERILSAAIEDQAGAVARVQGDDPHEPDAFGKLLMFELALAGLRTDGLISTPGGNTAVCSLTLEKDGDLVAGVADMGIVESLSADTVEKVISGRNPKMVVFDCNLLEGSIRALLQACLERGIPTFCDPTSTPKLPRLLPSLVSLLPADPTHARPLTHLSPNVLELDLLYSLLSASASSEAEERSWAYVNSLGLSSDWRHATERFTSAESGRGWLSTQGVIQKMVACLPYVGSFWVKASSRGLLHLRVTDRPASRTGVKSSSISQPLEGLHQGKYLVLTHHQPPEIKADEIVSTTGAGDTLAGGLVAGLVDGGAVEDEWVRRALDNVRKSLMSRRAVG
ncbi:hypothetical protein IAU60_001016 [Kwoniella sp. DSM 27419]